MSTMTGPSVTVVVPIYNIADELPACLDSLLAQTFTDFEVELVDDGSTDGSEKVARAFAGAHAERFRYHRKSNGGLGDARNFGIGIARGECIAFVDGDDLVAPSYLERLHSLVRSGADVAVCGIRSFDDADGLAPYYPEPDMSVFGRSLAEEPRLLYRVDASACNKLFTLDLFNRTGIRFPVGVPFEDLPVVYGLLIHARRVDKVDEPLYLYRQGRGTSITGRHDERFLGLVEALDSLDATYEREGLSEAHQQALLRLNLTHLIAGRFPDLLRFAARGVRRRYLVEAFRVLDARFPGWRGAEVVRAIWPGELLRAVATRKHVLDTFCFLPDRLYMAVLRRGGGFDPNR